MSTPMVFVVDDDAGVRKGLTMLLQSAGHAVEAYGSAPEFLAALDPAKPGCLVLDVRMPGMSGLELQEKLKADGIGIPVIILTGHGDVPMAVKAMQAGAVDFIEKPFREQVLLDRIRQAIAQDAEQRATRTLKSDMQARLAKLTTREHEVLQLVVQGLQNKAIAAELNVTVKTIEFHRSRIMERMEAANVADLVRMVLAAEK